MQFSCVASWNKYATCSVRNLRYIIESTGMWHFLYFSQKFPQLCGHPSLYDAILMTFCVYSVIRDQSPDYIFSAKLKWQKGVTQVRDLVIWCVRMCICVSLMWTRVCICCMYYLLFSFSIYRYCSLTTIIYMFYLIIMMIYLPIYIILRVCICICWILCSHFEFCYHKPF